MKIIKILLIVFAAVLFFSSCDNIGDGTTSLVDGGTVNDQGVAVNPPYVPSEGVEVPEGNYVYSPNEASNLKASTKARLRFDEKGRIIGMWGTAYDPCKEKPCAEEETTPDTEEFRKKTSVNWNMVKKVGR